MTDLRNVSEEFKKKVQELGVTFDNVKELKKTFDDLKEALRKRVGDVGRN